MNAYYFIQKLLSVLLYLLFLAVTIYTVVGPTPNNIVVIKGQTYITPAYWINFVWIAIHALIGGFVIYQWFESGNEVAVDGIGWFFAVSATLSICCLASLVQFPAENWCHKIFMLGSFSLWHGWVVYFGVINLFQAFTTINEDGPSIFQRILVIIGLIFLTSTAIGYVEYKKYRGDVAGATVIGIGLNAIFSNQHDPWIYWIALACAIITLLYATRPYLFRLISSEENVSLIT